ncbi:glycosyltransferase family 2 protein [Schaalia sp. 19OD2882]|uniref:glycosyltransferase family 2 protein n=1 Tax=Schaalia sp. 19OD2882 TaxID=2794089 RepID=UPI001C1EE4AF|nr:glycosyltransferase family 2 protein [Schaalia sp. 19OD2882]
MIRATNTLYIVLLMVWAILFGFTIPWLLSAYAENRAPLEGFKAFAIPALVVFNALFISYFWLNGLKDIVYVTFYYLGHRRLEEKFDGPQVWRSGERVLLVYCTANDFNAESLDLSMRQDYANFRTVILDDSKDPEFMRQVDEFAWSRGIPVVRREGREGFKAGNINNFLWGRTDYDYFVLLDSDEIIPPDFITKALRYFRSYKNLGILQATHVASRNRNSFMKTLSVGVDSHWPTYQLVKGRFGFLSLLGHGAMISRECYQAAGGFPHVVAEDLCFSLEARMKGYRVSFAHDIICEEEYPVDYLAFKKRHSKWTQGNMEFIKQYTKRILTSPLRWYEKLDIILFTYNLPLTVFFSLYLIMNVVVFPALGYDLHYPAWLLVPTIMFLVAPMLNDIIWHTRSLGFLGLLKYLLSAVLLYGSMFYVSLESSFLSLFGKKAVFLVTPKDTRRIGFLESLRFNVKELLFGIVLSTISWVMMGSVLPVLLLVVPAMLSPLMTMYSNYGTEEEEPPASGPTGFPGSHNLEAFAPPEPAVRDPFLLPAH